MVTDLRSDLYYLASGAEGTLGVVVVEGPEGCWAPVFSQEDAARRLAERAPAGVKAARAAARDPRAREELLVACLLAGAEVLQLDPDPERPRLEHPVPARGALAYVRSFRTEAACL